MARKASPKRRSMRRKSARKASPKRRSMRRKSARKASPKRRSMRRRSARKASPKRRSMRRRSARKASPKRRRSQRGGGDLENEMNDLKESLMFLGMDVKAHTAELNRVRNDLNYLNRMLKK
jgi:hypothetical protein